MKTKTLILFTVLLSFVILTCDKQPTEPKNDNPFDIENPQTGGDRFKLTAKIAGGGITLEWTKPDFEALQSYKIYRSETETTGYSELGTAAANKTSYIDKQVENGHSYWYLVTVVSKEGKETSRTNEAAVNINTEPVFVINDGDQYTPSIEISLTILAISAQQMMLANSADFSGAGWETYATSKNWMLPTGAGGKTVFMKVKYDSTESEVVQASILPQEVSSFSFSITDADTINTLDVTLNIQAEYATKMKISNDSLLTGSEWENYQTSKAWHLDFSKAQDNKVKVYVKFMNDFEMETAVINNEIYLQIVSGIKINNGDTHTSTRAVTLNIFSENADEIMISNNADFSGAIWESYVETKSWVLPTGSGPFTVYAKFKNSSGLISDVYSDEILPQPINPSIEISGGAQYSQIRDVQLTLSATGENLQMKLSEDSTFSGISWQTYSSSPNFQLTTGDGTKKVYAKIKNDFEIESILVSDEISPRPINPSIEIAGGAQYSFTRDVQLTLSATGANIQMKLSEDSTFSGTSWQTYNASPNFQLTSGEGTKKVFARFKNDFEMVSDNIKDEIIVDTTPPTIVLTVTPDSVITNETNFQFDPTASSDNLTPGNDLQIRFDYENDGSFDTDWIQLSAFSYQYSVGGGDKTVKMQLKDGAGWEVETTKTIFVNTRPQASFTAIEDEINLELWHFDASASTDYEDGENIEYRWDFDGDGGWDTAWLTTDTISYEYANDGAFNAKLTVRDQNALTAEQIEQVSIVFTMTDQDGNVYKIIKIDAQWWMAENLKVTHYRNSEAIPNVTDKTAWKLLYTDAYCSYDNDNNNVSTYGLLYNWYAVDDSRNIAPTGWHMPTDEEWKQLEMYLGMSQSEADDPGDRGTDEGSKLKAESGWNSGGNGTNSSGFMALPGGYRDGYGAFENIGSYGNWWSATAEYSGDAWSRYLNYNNSAVGRYGNQETSGFSIRLVRD